MNPHKAAQMMLDLTALDQFATNRAEDGKGEEHALWLLDQVAYARVYGEKAHRWLAYAQGLLVSYGMTTLQICKDINEKSK